MHYNQNEDPHPPSYMQSQIDVGFQPIPVQQHTRQPMQNLQPQFQIQMQPPAPIIVTQVQPNMHRVLSEEVCCTTARAWSNLIAWVQIVGCASGFIFAIVILANLSQKQVEMYSQNYRYNLRTGFYSQNIAEKDADIYVESTTQKLYTVLLLFGVLSLIMSTFGFSAGVLLQQGVKQKKPWYLSAWIAHAGVNLLVAIGTSVTLIIIQEDTLNTFSPFLFTGNIGVNSFFIWVVNKHRREIEQFHRRQSHLEDHVGSGFSAASINLKN